MSDTTAQNADWYAKSDAVPPGITQVSISRESDGHRIATVYDTDAVPLIAAAPDLLAALRSIIDLADAYPNLSIGYVIDRGVCANTRAAIAKAEGRE